MKIVFSKKCTEYQVFGHPESPTRTLASYEYLLDKGFEFIEPKLATKEDILLVHSQTLYQSVKDESFSDPDTPVLLNIFDYARLSAGAAISAMELSLRQENSFSLMRPPGHHAQKNRLGGFCYFNNIAIATKKAALLGRRVAVLDIDCHHGNGTEDIFLGEEGILYVSLHQVPLYPGTGHESRGNCLNYPLRAGTREGQYLEVLKDALIKIKAFSPELLAISAGFDTYKGDPLANIELELGSYHSIARMISEIDIPCFCVLEGGYSVQLKDCIYEFLGGFAQS